MQHNAHIEAWIDYCQAINRTMSAQEWLEWRDTHYPTY